MTAVPFEETGRYSCPLCPRRFHELVEKKRHIRLKHTRKAKKQ